MLAWWNNCHFFTERRYNHDFSPGVGTYFTFSVFLQVIFYQSHLVCRTLITGGYDDDSTGNTNADDGGGNRNGDVVMLLL